MSAAPGRLPNRHGPCPPRIMKEHRHCEPPESGPVPHTDLGPDGVTASAARQSMGSGVLDCFTLFAMTGSQ